MTHTLIVNGMHCNACVSLINMEIDELGLADKVQSLSLKEGENQGELALKDVSQEEIEKIIQAINSLEPYSVQQ